MVMPEWLQQRGRGWSLGLAAWTLFAWVNRIGNVLGDDELSGFARTWRVGVAVAFVTAGLAIIVLLLAARGRRTELDEAGRRLAFCLAIVGSGWWLVRGGWILVGEWEVGFKVVHTVLAIVTVALSSMVVRSTVRRAGRERGNRRNRPVGPTRTPVDTDAGAH